MAYQPPTRCFICGKGDEFEDPTLWIACTQDDPSDQCCRLSCHIDCAFDSECVGVTDKSQFVRLDAKYWCISCGKISDLLGYWRQQVSLAKDAHFVDDLYKRLSLSYKLMNGTEIYSALQENVRFAKAILEVELSNSGNRCLQRAVNGLSVADQVQQLCVDAIDKVDKLMASPQPKFRVDPYPPACRIIFEEITAVSMKIILVEIPSARFETLKGFNIWCWRSKHEACLHSKEDLSFPIMKNRVNISNLQPWTEYAIRVVSYNVTGNAFGITEVKCKTPPAPISEVEPHSDNIVPSNPVDIPDLNDDAASVEAPTLVGIPDLNTDYMEDVPNLNDELEIRDLNDQPSAEGLSGKVTEESDIESRLKNNEVGLTLSKQPMKGGSMTQYFTKIASLQQKGLIDKEFMTKFLTWFGLNAKEEEKEVVYAYIEALDDNPESLARQLIHSFNCIHNKQ